MRSEKFYLRVWKTILFLSRHYLTAKFNYTHDKVTEEGPFLVVSNHVTNWDPMLVALSFPNNNLHYVASEHLFRMGRVSKLIEALVAPISRRKGTSGLDTAMHSLRTIKAGGSVCVFGEGECTWNGKNIDIVPSTGTLARASGAKLVTYRLEGGYFTLPRWSDVLRKGKMRGHVVNIYTPEQLKAMKPQEINDLINRDIFEDAQARQDVEKQRYRSKKRAEGLENVLFLCPKCKRVGTLKGEGSHFRCSCGLDVEFTEYGEFAPATYFRTIVEWDKWQCEALESGDIVHGEEIFADEDVVLNDIAGDHSVTQVAAGRLSLKDGGLYLDGQRFDLKNIHDMAIVRTNRLFFDYGDKYYELRAFEPRCLRKYRLVWQAIKKAQVEKEG